MASISLSTTGAALEGVEDHEGRNHWTDLAQKHWLRSKRVKKVSPEVIKKEIWDVLEASDFDFASLLALDNAQLLEKYKVSELFWMTFVNSEQILMAGLQ